MSRVLITGGAGFIGSHLAEALIERGAEVTIFDRMLFEQARNLDPVRDSIRYVQGDIRDHAAIAALVDPGMTCIYHLASVVGVKHYVADPLAVVDVVIGGTRGVLEAARRNGVRTVVASTSEVFGKNPAVPWNEDADRVLGPASVDRWSYSSSKAVCEHMAYALARTGLPTSIVRFFNVYGPRQSPIYVVSQTVRKALQGERPLLYDDGAQTRCFTYVGDVIRGVLAAGSHPAAIGESFNLGSTVEMSIAQVIDRILVLAGRPPLTEAFDTSVQYGAAYEDIPRRVPGVEKAARLLGWRATTPLDEGLLRTIEWARTNAWWMEGVPA
jgi:dTDP-alpha-D-glucuronic acid decarboxylase